MSKLKRFCTQVATCLSCGAAYGSPHGPDCEFEVGVQGGGR